MAKRILTASVLIIALIAVVICGGLVSPYIIDVVVWICAIVAVHEMHGTLKRAGYDPIVPGLVVACVATVPLAAWLSAPGAFAGIALGAIAALTVFTAKHNYELKDLMATGFVMIYPLALTSIFTLINHGYGSMLGILLAIVIPVMTDTMAYFVGVSIGGRKLCPNISPKKTVSGAVGGIVGGILGAFIIFVLFDWTQALAPLSSVTALTDDLMLSLAIYLALGYLGGFVCEVGDLAASWIKRKAGIKDFGKIFPGHGGLMDRLDSIMFMLPIVYLLFACVNAFSAA